MASGSFTANNGLFALPLHPQPSSDDLHTPLSQISNPLDDIDTRSTLSAAMEPVPGLAAADVSTLAKEIDRIKQTLHLNAPNSSPKGHRRSSSGYAAYVFTRFRNKDGEVSEVEKSLDALKKNILALGSQQHHHLKKRPSLLSRRLTSSDALRLSTVREDSDRAPADPDLTLDASNYEQRLAMLNADLKAAVAAKDEADAHIVSLQKSAREQENAQAARLAERDGSLSIHLRRHEEETSALQRLLHDTRTEREEDSRLHDEQLSSVRQSHRKELDDLTKNWEQLRSSHAVELENIKSRHAKLDKGHDNRLAAAQQDHERVIDDLSERLMSTETQMRQGQVDFEKRLEAAKGDARNASALAMGQLQAELKDFRASHDKLIIAKDDELVSLQNRLQGRVDELDRVRVAANDSSRATQDSHRRELEQLRESHANTLSARDKQHRDDQVHLEEAYATSQKAEQAQRSSIEEYRASLEALKEEHRLALDNRDLEIQTLKSEHARALADAQRKYETESSQTMTELAKLKNANRKSIEESELRTLHHAEALNHLRAQHVTSLEEKSQIMLHNQVEHHRALSVWVETAEQRQVEAEELRKSNDSLVSSHKSKVLAMQKNIEESQQEIQEMRQSIAELEIEFSEKDRQHSSEIQALTEEHNSVLLHREAELESVRKRASYIESLEFKDQTAKDSEATLVQSAASPLFSTQHAMNIEEAHAREIENVKAAAAEQLNTLREALEQLKGDHTSALTILEEMRSQHTSELEKWNRQLSTLKTMHAKELSDQAQELQAVVADQKSASTASLVTEEAIRALKENHAAVLREKDRTMAEMTAAHDSLTQELQQAHQDQLKQWEASVLQQIQAVQEQNSAHLREIRADGETRTASATRDLQAQYVALQAKHTALEDAFAKVKKQPEQHASLLPAPQALITPANTSRARSPPAVEEVTLKNEHLLRQLDDVLEEKNAFERLHHTHLAEITSLKNRLVELETKTTTHERQREILANQLFAVRQKLRDAEEREARLEKALEDAVRRERHAERARDALLARSSSLTPQKSSGHRPKTGDNSRSAPLDAAFVTPEKANKELRALNESLLSALNDLRERHQRAQIQLMELRGTGTPISRSMSARQTPGPKRYPAKKDIEAAKNRILSEYRAKLDTVVREKAALNDNVQANFEHSVSAARQQIQKDLQAHGSAPGRVVITDSKISRPTMRKDAVTDEASAKLQELVDEYEAKMSELFERRDKAHPVSLSMDASEVGELVKLHHRTSSGNLAFTSPTSIYSSNDKSGNQSTTGSEQTRSISKSAQARRGDDSPLERRKIPHRHLESEWEREASSSSSKPVEEDVFYDFDTDNTSLLDEEQAVSSQSLEPVNPPRSSHDSRRHARGSSTSPVAAQTYHDIKGKRKVSSSPYGVRPALTDHRDFYPDRKSRMILSEGRNGQASKQMETQAPGLAGDLSRSIWANTAVRVVGQSTEGSGQRVSKESRRDDEEAWWSKG